MIDGFTSMEEFLSKSDEPQVSFDKKINQKSNVFSYYIIKCALLFNLTEFLKLFPTIKFT